jgi:hypothetical protein
MFCAKAITKSKLSYRHPTDNYMAINNLIPGQLSYIKHLSTIFVATHLEYENHIHNYICLMAVSNEKLDGKLHQCASISLALPLN